MSSLGDQLKITIFGESHAEEIGIVIEGLPGGKTVDFEILQRFLNRRAPGRSPWSTSRREPDRPEFLSGLKDGVTTGGTLKAVIRNTDIRPADYGQGHFIPRPGHADYTARVKYGPGYASTGGGPFSGRMTAPLCVAGGICLQLLTEEGIRIISRIARIADIVDETPLTASIADKEFPVVSDETGERMKACIEEAKAALDSVGGVIECAVLGLPAGLGGPLFEGMEGLIAKAVFGIPAVKGVEFGEGFNAAVLRGSENNDPFAVESGRVVTTSNHCGGILGGITNGMPLVFRVAVKPTPSIGRKQQSVDLDTMEPAELEIKGRHDPCIVPRAVPAVEAAAALAVYDVLLREGRIRA